MNEPYLMNQTEQIAVSQTTSQIIDKGLKAFAPASAFVNKITIDFKKLQAFKSK